MAKRTWIGGDTIRAAQVETFTVTAGHAGDVYEFRVKNEGGVEEIGTGVITGAGNSTTSIVATNMANAWNASTHPLAMVVTASSDSNVVSLTADTPGVPFYVTAAVTGGNSGRIDAGTTAAGTITTANRGPHDYGNPHNWKEGEIPVDGSPGDDVVITGNVPILYGLDQSAIGIDGITAVAGSSVRIGDEAFSLRVAPVSFTWSGKGIAYIDTGTSDFTEHDVWDTADVGTPGQAGLYLKHIHTGQDLNIYKGNVGIALPAGDVATFDNIFIRGSDVTLTVGDAVTINTAVHQFGGHSEFRSNPKAITLHGGTMTTTGVGYTVASCTIEGGTYFMKHSTVCNSITVNDGGVFDCSANPYSITLGGTKFSVKPGATVLTDPTGVTFTNLPTPAEKCKISFTRV